MDFPNPERVFSISSPDEFERLALEVFRFQAKHLSVYRDFTAHLKIEVGEVERVEEVPFLPIEFFKSHQIITENKQPEITFSSSGTTGVVTSSHPVAEKNRYEMSFERAFYQFYGEVKNYCVLALLPAYLEREGSSLVYMADALIRQSKHPDSGFYLYNYDKLCQQLNHLQLLQQPTILIGVTFALLDFVEQYSIDFPELIVMETGGMKGRRKEMIRAELHEQLTNGFGVEKIHSEYGMTELLSQAYSYGNGLFACPPWMKVLLRDTNDPLTIIGHEQTGGINIIDLANIYSCSFIATQDLGRTYAHGFFEPLGRFDYSDIRGCNLLVQ